MAIFFVTHHRRRTPQTQTIPGACQVLTNASQISLFLTCHPIPTPIKTSGSFNEQLASLRPRSLELPGELRVRSPVTGHAAACSMPDSLGSDTDRWMVMRMGVRFCSWNHVAGALVPCGVRDFPDWSKLFLSHVTINPSVILSRCFRCSEEAGCRTDSPIWAAFG